ncbi:MAG: rhodanese-like domain-containing protein [Candidatus Riflebacteria bacterium]
MKKFILFSVAMIAFVSVPIVQAFDENLASNYQSLFAPVTGPGAGKGLNLISPEVFVKKLDEYKEYMILDIRTPEETAIFGMNFKHQMLIPVSELFKPESLKKLPNDRRILVVCSSGSRSAAAAIALRSLGFKDIFILMGGYSKLAGLLATPAPLAKD